MKDSGRPIVLSTCKSGKSEHSRLTTFFDFPLSDFDIISLQNLLMTPSVHFITTKNIDTGRSLMNLFLTALKHYHNVGCLTVVDNQKLLDHVFDFSRVKQEGISFIDSIELFLIEYPYLDFVWIELTQTLQNQISQSQLRTIYDLFSAESQTPVLVMSYEESGDGQ